MPTSFEKRAKDKQYNPDGNRTICNIKGWPMPSVKVKIQKIYYRFVKQPINYVAQCTADNHT